MSNKQDKICRENRRQFLLTFFDKENGYTEKEINGFWLIKHWNGNSKKWVVDIYTQKSYNNYKNAKQKLCLDFLLAK